MNDESQGQPGKPAPSRYVAVVHFHGIGEQRQYEEISMLAERLDETATHFSRLKISGFPSPNLDNMRARYEPYRGRKPERAGSSVVYLQATYGRNKQFRVRARFYEAYWAPETAGGATLPGVLIWLLRQLPKPFQLLGRRWRRFERLRRGDLYREAMGGDRFAGFTTAEEKRLRDAYSSFARAELPPRFREIDYDAWAGWAEKAEPPLVELIRRFEQPEMEVRSALKSLLGNYSSFFGREARQNWPEGTWSDFLKWIKTESPAARDLAKAWRRRHLRSAWFALGAVGLVFLTILSATAILLQTSYGLLELSTRLGARIPMLGNSTKLDASQLMGVAAALASLLGIAGFLRDYVGDVQQFTTYHEAKEAHRRRRAVLDAAIDHLEHVLADPVCQRVVITAHSLGTAVALDALLELGRWNYALSPGNPLDRNNPALLPLWKIEHLFTCGSPIDKLQLFFRARKADARVYDGLLDSLEGDISDPPLAKPGKQQQIRWINYWDLGDPISGPLDTVLAEEPRQLFVENVRVASHVLPDPVTSHASYFTHQRVMRDLFEMIFRNRYSVAEPPRGPQGEPLPEYPAPGGGRRRQTILFALLPVLPLLLAATACQLVFGFAVWAPPLALALVALFALGTLMHRRRLDHQSPLGR